MKRLLPCITIALLSVSGLSVADEPPASSNQALRAVQQAMQQRFTQGADLGDDERLQLATVLCHAYGDPADARTAIELLVRQAQELATVAPPREAEATRILSRRVMMLCLAYQHLHEHFDAPQRTAVRDGLLHAAGTLARTHAPSDRERIRSDATLQFAAVGLVAGLFPDDPRAAPWLDHATSECAWQLRHAIHPDGSWRGGPRDHAIALRALVQLAVALKEANRVDLFRETRFAATFEAFMRLQTPRDAAAGGVALLPDDAGIAWSNAPFAVLASAAKGFAPVNPAMAGRLMGAWQRAGSPWITAEDDLPHVLLIDPTLQPLSHAVPASHASDAGVVVLRQHIDTPDEMQLAVQLTNTGSISLHAAGTPLILPTTAGNSVSVGLPVRRPGAIEHAVLDPQVRFLSVDLSTADRDAIYRRRVLTLEPNVVILWDNVARGHGAELRMHIVGREPGLSSHDGIDRLRFACFNGVTLDWSILQPRDAHTRELLQGQVDALSLRVTVEHLGAIVPAYEATPIRVRLRQAAPHEDLLSVLAFAGIDAEPAAVRPLAAPAGAHAVRVTHGGTHWGVYLQPQHSDAIRSTAVATVVRTDAEQALERLVMIDGMAVSLPGDCSVTASTATSLALDVVDAGRRYELAHLGDAAATLTVTLPWSRPDAALRVHRIRKASATLLPLDGDADELTLEAEPGDRFILQR